jgi:hypothetical protein
MNSTLKKRKSLNSKLSIKLGLGTSSSSLSGSVGRKQTKSEMISETGTDDATALFNRTLLNNSSSSSCSSNNQDTNGFKIRLNKIDLKHLTLVELKYLKQICFNKLKKQMEALQAEQQKQRKNSNNSGNFMPSANGVQNNISSSVSSTTLSNCLIRLAIPKGILLFLFFF